jgi:hypothetical protein
MSSRQNIIHTAAHHKLDGELTLGYYSFDAVPMTLEGPQRNTNDHLAGRWDDVKREETHRFADTIRDMFGGYARHISESTLPEKHKQIILRDLQKLENSYATSRGWDSAPESAFEIEDARTHRSERIVKYATE